MFIPVMATTEIYPIMRSDADQNASKQPGLPDSSSLMHMILRYLDQDSPKSPEYSPQGNTLPRLKQWRENLGDLESPILGKNSTKFLTIEDSSSDITRSPIGSVFSGSEGMGAPSTRASSIDSEEDATRKDVSHTNIQSTTTLSASNSTRSKVSIEPSSPMIATITDFTELMPEFMPEFITPPQTPINKERSVAEQTRTRMSYPAVNPIIRVNKDADGEVWPIEAERISPRNIYAPSRPISMNHLLNLKIDTSNLTRPKPTFLVTRDPNIQSRHSKPPARRAPSKSFPEVEFSKPVLPSLHVADLTDSTANDIEIPSPTPSRRSLVLSKLSKRLRRGSQTPILSPENLSVQVPNPSRKLLGELNRHTLEWSRLSASEMSTESELTSRDGEKVKKTRDPPDLLRIGRPVMKRLEKIVEVLPLPERVVKQGPASGTGFRKEFFTGKKGLQMRMVRKFGTRDMMEWDIDDGEGKRLIRCQQRVHSLSRRKDFFDADRQELFNFQEKIGSTRVAESPNGTTLFSIKNASISTLPHWTINIPATSSSSATKWVARGDPDMRSVLVTWGDYEVGRITAASQKAIRKHTYNITIARETNFCIMAALATVLDDLRVDEMY